MQTVLFTRHADIDLPPTSSDPELNAAGAARAEELAHVVHTAQVASVFTSTLRRTKLTAAPPAARLGLRPAVAPPAAELARRVLAGELGAVVLVVGHSNTVPEMIAALGVTAPPTIGEREFDNLFVVTVADSGEASSLALKYGETSLR
ncbi:MAG: phosphoglycerate mutase family protein [Actinophytocola sp.]|uniref:phosphoglycerate mutase family protein n=1 Tax=Actinophytocola sp. TaxID=1872138 RepID=UPI003D6AEA09